MAFLCLSMEQKKNINRNHNKNISDCFSGRMTLTTMACVRVVFDNSDFRAALMLVKKKKIV
jgi:hypothetical protein